MRGRMGPELVSIGRLRNIVDTMIVIKRWRARDAKAVGEKAWARHVDRRVWRAVFAEVAVGSIAASETPIPWQG